MFTDAESFSELLYKGAVTNLYGRFHDIAKTGEASWYNTQLTDESIRMTCDYIGQLVTATPDERVKLQGEGLIKLAEQVIGGKLRVEDMACLILGVISELPCAVKTGGAFFVINYYIENQLSSIASNFSNTTLMSAVIDIIRIGQSKVELRKDAHALTRAVFGMVKRGENVVSILSGDNDYYTMDFIVNLMHNVPLIIEDIKKAIYDASTKQGSAVDMDSVLDEAFKISFYDGFYGAIVGGLNKGNDKIKDILLDEINFIVDIIKSIV